MGGQYGENWGNVWFRIYFILLDAGQDREEAEDDLFMWSLKRCGRAVTAEHSQQLTDKTVGGSYGVKRCGHQLVCWLGFFKLDQNYICINETAETSEFLRK